VPHGEQLDILSGVLDGYSGLFFRTSRSELSCKFVGHFRVTFLMLYHALQGILLDITSGVSRSLNSILCPAC